MRALVAVGLANARADQRVAHVVTGAHAHVRIRAVARHHHVECVRDAVLFAELDEFVGQHGVIRERGVLRRDRNLMLVAVVIETDAADVDRDQVAIETRYLETENGFIKSRYLDDKASAATLLRLAQRVADGEVKLNRKVSLLFTEYEEIGHGGACGIPADTKDLIAVDIGCIGLDHDSNEHKVTITTKDAAFPYHTVLTDELVKLCEKNGIPYALDMMVPSYGSDADVSLRAGYDVRHALIGPGVRETHGYERTHEDALKATLALISAVAEA